ncbi:hypothetical protein BEST7613_4373 [Synechocystis sp. PCC 6803]|nr:hypothetical protein BEST7613_4373 [Synechocystis sp. PCC 6803] [Bacillus subtilis BEST7613]
MGFGAELSDHCGGTDNRNGKGRKLPLSKLSLASYDDGVTPIAGALGKSGELTRFLEVLLIH